MSFSLDIPYMDNQAFAKGDRRKETIRILKGVVATLEEGLDECEDSSGECYHLKDANGGEVGSYEFEFWDESMFELADLQRAWENFKGLTESGVHIEHSGCAEKRVYTVAEWLEWDETCCENAWMEMEFHEAPFPCVEDILNREVNGLVL